MPDTTDTPTQLAILPDWGKRVRLVEQFETNLTRSFSGKSQASAKRIRPTYLLEYQRSGLTEAEARRRLLAIRSEFEKPLTVPIWPDGGEVASMSLVTGNDEVTLSEALPEGYSVPFDVYLWTSSAAEFRTVTAVAGAVLTLSGSSTIFAAGAHCFPCRTAVREVDAENLNSINAVSGIERIRFKTL
jgi:hypothetical protein